ncbi:hypothetical protein H9C73_14140 [Marinobacterium sp. AK62]|uniref:(R)-2-haloacid dehalogenase n=1 Tax=Marinobacterium alkalitolerans TaxID=1542925 RepID=A0ABS3ZDW1_9GAMM|nr:halocarboxylic acid dehydrogenase DehI family protein [Marinobacterium alkalitolerans]MBP0049869.1 hypothetical protein [Marinobacterium alkalitolerans]
MDHSNSALARYLPSPLPVIHPVPEVEAEDELLEVYQDTKKILRAPWMGVVTMAFAHYPHFYQTLWQGLRPALDSVAFQRACVDLRHHIEHCVTQLPVSRLTSRLSDLGYAEAEIDAIRDTIETFSAGNMPYLLLATQARLLLEGHALSNKTSIERLPSNSSETNRSALSLMEPHHCLPDTLELYDRIKKQLGLPFVNTDYRALARWPSYFLEAWDDLSKHLATPPYSRIVEGIHQAATDLALELPNPNHLTPSTLQQAAAKDANLQEVLSVVQLFQYLLPGLTANVAVFRTQLT